MSFLAAIGAGARRVLGAPRMLAAIWLVGFLVALPAAWAMSSILEESLGASLVQENLREGFDLEWYWLFEAGAQGIATTFGPGVVGASAFYKNLEAWITGNLFGAFPGVVAMGLLYALLWAFLLGGVLERLAHPEAPASLSRFVQAGGWYFLRFVRLALCTGVLYLLIYLAYRWIYGHLDLWTRDVTEEWKIFALSLLVLADAFFALVIVHVASDYAKIATVAREGRSMLHALGGGFRFIWLHLGAVSGIYFGLALVGAILLALYAMLAPGATQSTFAGVLFAFIVGQVFLLARLALRLTLLGSQTAYYQAMIRIESR
jgi:hypothetical protein